MNSDESHAAVPDDSGLRTQSPPIHHSSVHISVGSSGEDVAENFDEKDSGSGQNRSSLTLMISDSDQDQRGVMKGVDNPCYTEDEEVPVTNGGKVPLDHSAEYGHSNSFLNSSIDTSMLGEVNFNSDKDAKKNKEAAEAVNLELVNMIPYSSEKQEPTNGIPVKTESDDMGEGYPDPYDEYFVPVNEHRKYIRGEKLYVTKDKRKAPSWNRCVCWGVGFIIIAVAIIIAILAGTGVILAQEEPIVGSDNAVQSRSFSDSHITDSNITQQTEPPVTATSYEVSSFTPSPPLIQVPATPPTTEMSSLYVPKVIEAEFVVDNQQFKPEFSDPNSLEFQKLAAAVESELKQALFDIQTLNYGAADIYLKVIQLSPGSVVIKFRVGWIFKAGIRNPPDPIKKDDIRRKMEIFLSMFGGYLDNYHVNMGTVRASNVIDACQFNNGDCSHTCVFDIREKLDFMCECPENYHLDKSGKNCTQDTEPMTDAPVITQQLETTSPHLHIPQLDEPDPDHVMHPDNESDPDHVMPHDHSLASETEPNNILFNTEPSLNKENVPVELATKNTFLEHEQDTEVVHTNEEVEYPGKHILITETTPKHIVLTAHTDSSLSNESSIHPNEDSIQSLEVTTHQMAVDGKIETVSNESDAKMFSEEVVGRSHMFSDEIYPNSKEYVNITASESITTSPEFPNITHSDNRLPQSSTEVMEDNMSHTEHVEITSPLSNEENIVDFSGHIHNNADVFEYNSTIEQYDAITEPHHLSESSNNFTDESSHQTPSMLVTHMTDNENKTSFLKMDDGTGKVESNNSYPGDNGEYSNIDPMLSLTTTIPFMTENESDVIIDTDSHTNNATADVASINMMNFMKSQDNVTTSTTDMVFNVINNLPFEETYTGENDSLINALPPKDHKLFIDSLDNETDTVTEPANSVRKKPRLDDDEMFVTNPQDEVMPGTVINETRVNENKTDFNLIMPSLPHNETDNLNNIENNSSERSVVHDTTEIPVNNETINDFSSNGELLEKHSQIEFSTLPYVEEVDVTTVTNINSLDEDSSYFQKKIKLVNHESLTETSDGNEDGITESTQSVIREEENMLLNNSKEHELQNDMPENTEVTTFTVDTGNENELISVTENGVMHHASENKSAVGNMHEFPLILDSSQNTSQNTTEENIEYSTVSSSFAPEEEDSKTELVSSKNMDSLNALIISSESNNTATHSLVNAATSTMLPENFNGGSTENIFDGKPEMTGETESITEHDTSVVFMTSTPKSENVSEANMDHHELQMDTTSSISDVHISAADYGYISSTGIPETTLLPVSHEQSQYHSSEIPSDILKYEDSDNVTRDKIGSSLVPTETFDDSTTKPRGVQEMNINTTDQNDFNNAIVSDKPVQAKEVESHSTEKSSDDNSLSNNIMSVGLSTEDNNTASTDKKISDQAKRPPSKTDLKKKDAVFNNKKFYKPENNNDDDEIQPLNKIKNTFDKKDNFDKFDLTSGKEEISSEEPTSYSAPVENKTATTTEAFKDTFPVDEEDENENILTRISDSKDNINIVEGHSKEEAKRKKKKTSEMNSMTPSSVEKSTSDDYAVLLQSNMEKNDIQKSTEEAAEINSHAVGVEPALPVFENVSTETVTENMAVSPDVPLNKENIIEDEPTFVTKGQVSASPKSIILSNSSSTTEALSSNEKETTVFGENEEKETIPTISQKDFPVVNLIHENETEVNLDNQTENTQFSKCAAGQFQCTNGTAHDGFYCISMSSKCDSVRDCSDGSDEIGCIEKGCPGNFQCSSGQCLKRHLVCNGIVDCNDGSDEVNCDKWKCLFDEYQCPSGRCIPVLWQCDGKADCSNHTDEFNCQSSCSDNEFLCPERWCIPVTLRCNGVADCAGGEDELLCDCSVDQFKCNTGGCVMKSQVCDGIEHCPDFSDEWNCLRLNQDTMLLEVRSSEDKWYQICSDGWNSSLSDAVCQNLGYSMASFTQNTFYGNSTYYSLKPANAVTSDSIKYHFPAVVEPMNNNSKCAANAAVEISCQEFTCGSHSTADGVAARLVGGDKAMNGQWPSVALLYQVKTKLTCTASIISPKWLLASYNCLHTRDKDLNPNSWAVFGGGSMFDTGKPETQIKEIHEIVPYPQLKYNQFLYNNDVVLIELSEPFTFTRSVGAICLPEKEIEPRQICVTAGWGFTAPGEINFSQYLQYLPLPTINLTECNSTTHYAGLLTKNDICAGYTDAERSPCHNDDGAPLMCATEGGIWELHGILSHHSNCGRGYHPSIFSSIASVRSWVEKTVGSRFEKKVSFNVRRR